MIYLSLAERSILVSDTQFPSMIPFPTVGIMLLRHATYNEHANQCITSPWQAKDKQQNEYIMLNCLSSKTRKDFRTIWSYFRYVYNRPEQ